MLSVIVYHTNLEHFFTVYTDPEPVYYRNTCNTNNIKIWRNA
ncbi:hypothetical protein ALT1644_410040 [Alteromonas macleodii]